MFNCRGIEQLNNLPMPPSKVTVQDNHPFMKQNYDNRENIQTSGKKFNRYSKISVTWQSLGRRYSRITKCYNIILISLNDVLHYSIKILCKVKLV